MADLRFRGVVREDRIDLPPVARRIFTETFGHLYDTEPFRDFCDAAYGSEGTMVAELGDSMIDWRIAELEGKPVGYAKLRPLVAPAPSPRPNAMELQQIYVLSEWQGKGVADELMRWAFEAARKRGALDVYLTVFDHNERAKRCYSRHGFVEVGRCEFRLGSRVDDDRVWHKLLA